MSESKITEAKVASSSTVDSKDDSSSQNQSKHAGGRPTKYNLKIALEICDRLSDGESLATICKDERMPKKTAVYEWLLRHEEFTDMYARAREDQADSMADSIVAIADEKPTLLFDDKGNGKVDNAFVAWQKNRIDARKWTAAKLKPRKYSDRIAHEGVSDGDPIKVDVSIFDALVQNLELKRQNKDD
jgi:hypothetical protein